MARRSQHHSIWGIHLQCRYVVFHPAAATPGLAGTDIEPFRVPRELSLGLLLSEYPKHEQNRFACLLKLQSNPLS